MTNERKLDILRAIVSRYIQTREPVSSKAIASSQHLDVSSATIRNDMSALEDLGYIFQPHTSAGRVPTEAGYRLFVDKLTDLRPLSKAQRNAIKHFLEDSVDFEDVISRTVRLLADLTRTAAVIEVPSLKTSTFRRVEVVDLAARRLMIIVVTSSGRVEERIIETEADVSRDLIDRMRDRFNDHLEGLETTRLSQVDKDIVAEFALRDRVVVSQVLAAILEEVQGETSSRMVVAGLSYLARTGADFEDVSGVLDALEEQVVLLRLLSEIHTAPVQVSIGTENQNDALGQTSIVSARYNPGAYGQAHLGVVGPTRMDYSRSLVAVEAVSSYLSRFLQELS